jgi:alpha-galactosidase
VDDEKTKNSSVVFRVVATGRTVQVQQAHVRRRWRPLHVDLTGVHKLDCSSKTRTTESIRITPTGATRASRLCRARSPIRASLKRSAADLPEIASTKPRDEPAIHGPRVVGTTPGRPFLLLVPATGKAPIEFSADGLPAGLSIDPKTGVISGSVKSSGESVVTLIARNARANRNAI